jgi:galactokinase
MTGAMFSAALVDRGLDPRQLESKAALFDLVLSPIAPRQRGGLHAWWIPGRLEVFGKHTDYAGGRTIVCAVPRGFAVVARPRADRVLHVVDARRGQEVTRAPSNSPAKLPPYTGWRHYVDVVASRLARNFPGAPLGADIVIASDLPRASGMSSSSALVIAIAGALARVGALDRRTEWQENIAGPRDVAGYFACIENGLSFGSLSGDSGVGTHGGSEDHAAILTGVPNRLAAFAFVPMRAIAIVPVPERWRFVLSPCGVRAQKTGAAREAYNRLAEGTQLLLDLWNMDSPAAVPSLGAALLNSGDNGEDTAGTSPAAVDRLRALVRGSTIPGWPRDALEKRLDHFIGEDARIPEAIDAFRHADEGRIGRLAEGSQADAETLLGNQIPETSALARIARELGAFASSSFGAGFGGSVWALVEHDRANAFARHWHPDAFIAPPGPPVVELTATDTKL